VAKAQEIIDAAAAMALTGFTKHIEQFDALRQKYQAEPWYKYLKGNYVDMVLPVPANEITEKAKVLDVGTPWTYDLMPTLRALNTPQLWIRGDEDLAADGDERLSTRNSDGYFRMMRDYIVNGKLQGSYGRATLTTPKA
jgi:hypothetical protein